MRKAFSAFSLLSPLAGDLPSDHQRRWIAPGGLGTRQTLRAMQDLVTRAKRDCRLRPHIGNILRECPGRDYYCYAKALYEFCRDKVRYTYDPVGVELLEEPLLIITQSRIADCDSICVTLAALYEAIGLAAQFVTIQGDPAGRPGEWTHVYVRVLVPGHGWIGADATQPGKHFGWEPPETFRRKSWPASHDSESVEATTEGQPMLGEGPMPGLGRGSGYGWAMNTRPGIMFSELPGLAETTPYVRMQQLLGDAPATDGMPTTTATAPVSPLAMALLPLAYAIGGPVAGALVTPAWVGTQAAPAVQSLFAPILQAQQRKQSGVQGLLVLVLGGGLLIWLANKRR